MLLQIASAVLRAAAAYIVLLVIARLIGRKAISQMTFFDFCAAIALGAVAASMGLGKDSTFWSGLAVLLTMGLITILFAAIHLKSKGFRKLVNSEPVVLITNNQIVEANMKKVRLTLTELTAMLREKNAFNIDDVEYAVIENEGQLSVLLKSDKRPVTPADLQLHPPGSGLTKDIIIDGCVMTENLNSTNLTEEWLNNALRKQGISSADEVFFAALDASGGLYISRGIKGKEQPGQYGIE